MNFTEQLLCLEITTYLCSTSECLHAYSGESMSVATQSKVVQYWESEHVRRFYSDAIPFCLTPPTAALYPNSPVTFLLLLITLCHSFFAHHLSFTTTSSFLHPCSLSLLTSFWLLFSSYYSSLYAQRWHLQAGLIYSM